MSEILNRREQIKSAAIPPEIADASTLVTKTDYATASKAGVVKVGNNISVASGKISVPDASDEVAGVVKVGTGLEVDEDGALNVTAGGGMIVDVLYEGNITQGSSTPIQLAHNYTDYTFLYAVKSTQYEAQAGTMLYVPSIATGANNVNALGVITFRVDGENFDQITTPSGSGTVSGVKILGLK